MSTTYPDLPKTSFPDSFQTFTDMLDITAADAVNVKGFQEAMLAGNTELANTYFNQITNANKKFVTADFMNSLFQTCIAVQRFYKDDYESTIEQKETEWREEVLQMSYIGPFSLTTQYKRNNYVTYNNNIYIAITDPPIGTYPTDTNYWRMMTIAGRAGSPGANMSFVGEWSATQTYAVQNIVTYGDGLWAATAASTNQIPAEGSAYWQLIYRNAPVIYPVQIAQPADQNVGDLWFQIDASSTPEEG